MNFTLWLGSGCANLISTNDNQVDYGSNYKLNSRQINNKFSFIAQTPMLKGSIEHSEKLEPVPSDLKAGANFNFNNLPPANVNVIWYQIPTWLSGTFYRKYVTILESSQPKVDPPGLKLAEQTNHYGAQLDNNGDVWDCVCLPKYRSINSDNQTCNIQTYDMKIIQSNNENVIKEARAREVYYDSYSNQIIKTLQYESITIITKVNSHKIKINSSTKFYTDQGLPYAEDKRVSTMKRLETFRPQNIALNGINLRADFRAFLIKNNLLNLLP